MKSLISRIFKGSAQEAGEGVNALPSAPLAGQVYSFRTRPYSDLAPQATNRYAAFKVLGADDDLIAIAVLDGIWPTAPTLREIKATSIINEHRFAHTGQACVFGVYRASWRPENDLDDLRFAGSVAVTATERSLAAAEAGLAKDFVVRRVAYLDAANYAAEGEWRWSHDRDALMIEHEQKKARDAAERAAKEARYRDRLSKLTWDQLLSEEIFSGWSPSPPFPPEDFARAARETIHDACQALKELGPKPRRADVRAILKKTVLWFNEADEAAGWVIETEERETILTVLEEMAYLARQEILMDEIDAWREW